MKTWNKRLHKVNCSIQSWKQQWGHVVVEGNRKRKTWSQTQKIIFNVKNKDMECKSSVFQTYSKLDVFTTEKVLGRFKFGLLWEHFLCFY